MSNEKIRQDVLTYMESHATHPVSYDDLGRDLRYKGKGLGVCRMMSKIDEIRRKVSRETAECV